jgi:hypothetical protein
MAFVASSSTRGGVYFSSAHSRTSNYTVDRLNTKNKKDRQEKYYVTTQVDRLKAED